MQTRGVIGFEQKGAGCANSNSIAEWAIWGRSLVRGGLVFFNYLQCMERRKEREKKGDGTVDLVNIIVVVVLIFDFLL